MAPHSEPYSGSRAALVVAHPGHELRVYGWLVRARPDVYVLTDGSGRDGVSRLASTVDLLDRAGVVSGAIFGRFTDRQLYEALLDHDVATFTDLAAELAEQFITRGTTTVAGDSVEGYNPAHDVCRLIVDAAVAIAGSRGVRIENYDFAVVGADAAGSELVVILDDDELAQKMAAARRYREMKYEVDKAISEHGLDSFRIERFRRRSATADLKPPADPPFYESHGEEQVAAGYYRHVLRYREHIAPLNEAVLENAARPVCVL
ncbi:MAG: hypothetical protein ACXV5L_09785 [Thermoanaerobaculia bacterium]